MEQDKFIKILEHFRQDLLFKLKCAEVCKVERVNEKTIDCRPVVNILFQGKEIQAPLLTQVPIFNMQGGSSYEAFPIQKGDYVLVIFADKNTDNWTLGQDGKTQREFRFHDINDGFAFGCFNPNNESRHPIPDVIYRSGESKHDGNQEHNGNTTQKGNYAIEGNTTQKGNITASGTVTASSFSAEGNTNQTGNITASGTVTALSFSAAASGATMAGTMTLTGDIMIDGVSLKQFVSSHYHTAPSGGGNTSTPQGA
ncbi:MAG: hypothetical protein LBG21_02960 [Campylobacteraceae bacterium]|jgi:hypothetical protein|nr:hypothetical protein [Campylobacteraceae bacterium]